jgi:hypothetical protein
VSRLLGTGAVAGIAGGLVMTVWKMAEAALRDVGVWRPPNLIATIALGPSANSENFVAVPFIVGMTLHLLASITMGVLYAWAATRLELRLTASAEIPVIVGYALLNWAVYQWLIMPWFAPTMHAHTSPLSLAVAHAVFGLGMAAWWIPRAKTARFT